MDNPMQAKWGFPIVLERAQRMIEVTPELCDSYNGIRLFQPGPTRCLAAVAGARLQKHARSLAELERLDLQAGRPGLGKAGMTRSPWLLRWRHRPLDQLAPQASGRF
jgi:hypothetical protein